MIKCLICNKNFDLTRHFHNHIENEHNISRKDYYDTYLRKPGEGICPICNKPTAFCDIYNGYLKHCSRACSNRSKKHVESIAKTKLLRYNNASYNNPQKISEVLLSRTDEQKKETDLKDKSTRKQRYGDATYNNQRKRMSTMKSNKTIKMSKDEKIIYDKLISKFTDVEYSYYDENRYPYNCDFYVKSLDLFIEIHFSWLHGFHRYGTDVNDTDTLSMWKEKAKESTYYGKAIYVWSIDDINKFETAEKSKINYLVFYNMEQFNQWFNSL